MANIHNNINNDLEDKEPTGPEANEVVGDAQDEIVAETEQLCPDTDVNEATKTPPGCRQNQLAEY